MEKVSVISVSSAADRTAGPTGPRLSKSSPADRTASLTGTCLCAYSLTSFPTYKMAAMPNENLVNFPCIMCNIHSCN